MGYLDGGRGIRAVGEEGVGCAWGGFGEQG